MSASTKPAKPAFNKGGDDAIEASKQAPFASGKYIKSMSLEKDGDTILLRYITDYSDWIHTAEHTSVPTKAEPKGWKGKWPKALSAVCRNDKQFEGFYNGCYICDAKITNDYGRVIGNPTRIWVLAVVREEVIGDGSEEMGGAAKKGKRIGTTDKITEVEVTDKDGKPTGEIVLQKEYVIVNFAHKNYFSGLAAYYSEFETCCDRDYRIKRVGEGTDTMYTHVALEQTPNLMPGTEKWQTRYLDDLAKREIDLDEIVLEKSSDEYYAKFFDPSKKWEPKGEGDEGGTVVEDTSDEPGEPDEDEKAKMEALRARVQGQRAPVEVD